MLLFIWVFHLGVPFSVFMLLSCYFLLLISVCFNSYSMIKVSLLNI